MQYLRLTIIALFVICLLKKTVKRKTKKCVGCGGRAPFVFILCTKRKWSACRPIRFTPAERAQICIKQEVRGPQSRSGRCGEDATPLTVLVFEPRITEPVA
jgi:hypothetical protein